MTVLQTLYQYYGRMAARSEAELPGWTRQKISYALVLTADGLPLEVLDLRDRNGRKVAPSLMAVPAGPKRTSGIASNLLWDKTAFAFGRTAGDGRRTAAEHAAFKDAHRRLLDKETDAGLQALAQFVEVWLPERFDEPPFKPDMLDQNFVFRLEDDMAFLHQREAARRLIEGRAASSEAVQTCLVSGVPGPVARLHPSIRGVENAQSSGASLVSFNLAAFSSYGKERGENAPTSEAAAFRYGEALNRMLDRNSRNRLARPLGDAAVVFWADTSDAIAEDAAVAAEDWFVQAFDPKPDHAGDDDIEEAAKLRDGLQSIADGRPEHADPRLRPGTRFNILALSPNAGRLAVRWWVQDDFGALARRLKTHHDALLVEPVPWRAKPPSIARLLVKTTALLEKFDNIPPLLAGEVARAVLTGAAYPRTLLHAAIIRLRAGDNPGTGWHAAAIRAVLMRSDKEFVPVALDPESTNSAYQLGRLFALLESAQYAALGPVNAPISNRYYAAASSTPARVFPPLLRGLRVHLSDAAKRGKGRWIEPKVIEIMDHLPPDLPRTLRLEDQGRFAVGYYHQRKYRSAQEENAPLDEDAQT